MFILTLCPSAVEEVREANEKEMPLANAPRAGEVIVGVWRTGAMKDSMYSFVVTSVAVRTCAAATSSALLC